MNWVISWLGVVCVGLSLELVRKCRGKKENLYIITDIPKRRMLSAEVTRHNKKGVPTRATFTTSAGEKLSAKVVKASGSILVLRRGDSIFRRFNSAVRSAGAQAA